MLSAGDLNRTVVLKKPTVTRDAGGSKETVYVDTLTVRANIADINKIRALENNATALLNTDIVTIRKAANRAQVTEDWRIAYDGKDHTIFSIDPKGEFLTLLTKSDG